MKTLHGNTVVFGFVNCAAFNRDPSGDYRRFVSREDRDNHLNECRRRAISQGLAISASRSGIYPVKTTVAKLDASTRESLDCMGVA